LAIKNNVKPDTVLKTFWKNNQRFADLFNTVLFDFDTSDEFLSGLQKSDRLHPVISLCIYYGKEDWDGPFNLVDMLIMPEYLKPLVSDYRVNSGFCCKFTINYQTGISNNRERK